jgi:5'-nucleotidase
MRNLYLPGSADIELSNGEYFNLNDPKPDHISVGVVAHHLSQINRYVGATSRPYSVAEHTMLVADYLELYEHPPEVILSGLHHDDAEAFVHDITRPLKNLLPDYRRIEARVMKVVAIALNFDEYGIDAEAEAVKYADLWALSAEAFHLMPSQGSGWHCDGIYNPKDRAHWRLSSRIRIPMSMIHTEHIAQYWRRRHVTLCRAVIRNHNQQKERIDTTRPSIH